MWYKSDFEGYPDEEAYDQTGNFKHKEHKPILLEHIQDSSTR